MKSLRAQFADWAASKPADEMYDVCDAGMCAFAQFGDHIGADFTNKDASEFPRGFWDAVCTQPYTFGALAERLKAGA